MDGAVHDELQTPQSTLDLALTLGLATHIFYNHICQYAVCKIPTT